MQYNLIFLIIYATSPVSGFLKSNMPSKRLYNNYISMEFNFKTFKSGFVGKMTKSLESTQSQLNTLRAGQARCLRHIIS